MPEESKNAGELEIETDEEREEEAEKIFENLDIKKTNEETQKSLNQVVTIDLKTFSSSTLILTSERPLDPLGSKTTGSNSDEEKAKEITETVLTVNVAKLPPVSQWLARAPLFSAIFGGLSLLNTAAVATIAIYEAISSKAQNTPSPVWDLLPDDVKNSIETIVKEWISLSDNDLWKSVADYVSNFNPNITVQMLIMQDIIQFSPSVDWEWSSDDKIKIVNDLVTKYNEQKDFADIYRAVKEVTFKDKKLPRSIAAEVSRIALALILNQLSS